MILHLQGQTKPEAATSVLTFLWDRI